METLTAEIGMTAAGELVRVHVKPHSCYKDASEVRLMRGHHLVVDVAYVHRDHVSGVVERLGTLGKTWCEGGRT